MDHDVSIIGLGPVGATLAILLAQHGLHVAVYEREAAPYPLPRAVHIDGEVMRVLQQLGIADAIEPSLFVNLGMRFVDAEQQLLIDWPRPQEVGPHAWHASYRLHQPDLEEALGVELDGLSNVTVMRGVALEGIDHQKDSITATLRNLKTREVFQRHTGFLVGCDGARSFVRDWIGGGLIDLNSQAKWLVVDMIMKRPVPELSDWTIQLCDPDRPTTIARGTGIRRRWEFKIMPDDDLARMTDPDFIWSLLGRWIGPDDATVERTAVYNFHAVIAEKWRQGRVLIAGDAAHTTPPFLGQGLCAGIRDVSNLAWKLAAVHNGHGNEDRLLASYQSEREPHVRAFVAAAVRVGEVLQADAQTAAANKIRFAQGGTEMMQTPAPKLGDGLHDKDDPLAGQIAPQPYLADVTRMDDLVGNHWLLLARPDLVADIARGGPFSGLTLLPDLDGSLGRISDGQSLAAVLIRPDRYIVTSAQTDAQAIALPDIVQQLKG